MGRRPNGFLGLSWNDRTILFLVISLDKTVSVGQDSLCITTLASPPRRSCEFRRKRGMDLRQGGNGRGGRKSFRSHLLPKNTRWIKADGFPFQSVLPLRRACACSSSTATCEFSLLKSGLPLKKVRFRVVLVEKAERRDVKNYSCMFEISRFSAARQPGQPMHSQISQFRKV